MMKKFLKFLLPLAIVALLFASCKSEPVPGRAAATGDSVTFQAGMYSDNGVLASMDTEGKVGLGWRADHSLPRVQEDVAGEETSPEVLVVAFGHNYGSGFTSDHVNTFRDLLLAPHENACVVAVLPHYEGNKSGHAHEIERVRMFLVHHAMNNDNVVLVDWRPVVQAHPEYIDPDGIHLVRDSEWYDPSPLMVAAGNAYSQLMQDGVNQCYAEHI